MQNLLCVPMPSSVLDTIVEKRIVMKHSVQIEIGQMHLPHTNFAVENILTFIYMYVCYNMNLFPPKNSPSFAST